MSSLHERAGDKSYSVDGIDLFFKKLTRWNYEKKGFSALYEQHLAEDTPMRWVAETESQLQEIGGTESQMEQLELR